MVVIRLARIGRKKYSLYRIVAADKRRPVKAKFIAILGNYNPHTKELKIKKEETVEWMNKGAQPSNAVLKLLKKEGIKLPKWTEIKTFKKAAKVKEKKEEASEAKTPKPEEAKEPEAENKPETEKDEKQEKVAEVSSSQADSDDKKELEVKVETETPAELEKEKQTKEKTEEIAEEVTENKEKIS